MREHLFFEMWGDFLKNRRAQRLCVHCGIINNCDKTCIQNIAQRKAGKMESEPMIIEKTTFKKTPGPNGTLISMVSWKAGAQTKRWNFLEMMTCWRHLVDSWCHFGAHWILKGSHNRPFFNNLLNKWEKGGPRSGFKKTWFVDWFLMPKWEA